MEKSEGYFLSLQDKTGAVYKVQCVDSAKDCASLLPSLAQATRASTWLSKYQGKTQYSCAGFAYWMQGSDATACSPDHWSVFPASNATRTSVVLLSSTTRPENFHFAVRVEGAPAESYVSQFGNGGSVVVTGLNEMHRFFETDTVVGVVRMSPCD